MKPFLLITTRDDDAVVLPEVRSYQKLTGLTDAEMVWHRAEAQSLDSVNVHDYSGIILAGSPFTVSEPDEKKSAVEKRVELDLQRLLDRVLADDIPFLGVCYGVGTLGRHQGAVVDQTHGEPTQAAEIRLTEAGLRDRLFAELPPSFYAYVGHKEALSSVPDHVEVLATSQSCPIQAFRIGRNVYATQFHPEMDAPAISERIHAYVDHGYFDPARLDELLEHVNEADVRASHLVLGRFIEEYAK
ncbi:glutamine amidotransferase [Canibacter zhoujuaniae]|uniref:glutamine amidotransferase n=1 Tax=Canibacter zhoujuaniae TaxID=2708343 RepID=UPI00141F2C79|nr:glutamine amidotransferase [Canibacter zhoujuaniae]